MTSGAVPTNMRLVHWIAKYWLSLFLFFFGIFNVLPFLAPVLMNAGWTGGGNAIYTLYSPLCHQMAQRSFFFFGDEIMYTPEQLPLSLSGNMGADSLTLRFFKGNSDVGWKIAWSDRMVYMYGATWLAAFAFALIRRYRKVKAISPILFLVLLMPMGIDGFTHFISDFGGLTEGFRYDNAWLATITGHIFSASFYNGDTFGSFNSWMRLLSGLTFGMAIVGLIFPYLDHSFRTQAEALYRYRVSQQHIHQMKKELKS